MRGLCAGWGWGTKQKQKQKTQQQTFCLFSSIIPALPYWNPYPQRSLCVCSPQSSHQFLIGIHILNSKSSPPPPVLLLCGNQFHSVFSKPMHFSLSPRRLPAPPPSVHPISLSPPPTPPPAFPLPVTPCPRSSDCQIHHSPSDLHTSIPVGRQLFWDLLPTSLSSTSPLQDPSLVARTTRPH